MIVNGGTVAIRTHAQALLRLGLQPRILVVDDEQPIVDYVGRVLQRAGYQTTCVLSGAEALRTAEAADFELVLSDLRMPGMDGVELVRQLRQRQPMLKALYFTGFSDILFRDTIVLRDGEAFLDKPASILGILQAVGLMLFGHLEPGAAEESGVVGGAH
jgi:two-component system response regulator (stage 0 sporulation protein F)